MTIDTTAPARMLIQAQIQLSDQCCCSLPAEPTPVPGLAVIPHLRPDVNDLQVGARAIYDGRWAVLHLDSGHTITAALDTPGQAREQARLLGQLPIDWTAAAETIRKVDQQTRAAVSQTWVTACLFNPDPEQDDDYY